MSPVDETVPMPAQAKRTAPPAAGIVLLFVLVAAVMHVVFWQTLDRPSDRTLIGPDSYMRLVRVEQLLHGGGWHNDTIYRSNAPYGEVQHWTRPFDLLLIGLSLPLRPAVGAADALYWAGVIVSPLLHILICLAGAWAAGPLLGRHRLWMMPVLLTQWPLIAYVAPGRADHHSLIFLIFALGIGTVLRVLSEVRTRRWAVAAGIVHGLGLWITVVEFGVLLVVTTAMLMLAWAFARSDASERARQGVALSTAMGVVVAVAIVLDHAGPHALVPTYDRLSVVHLTVVGILGAAWLAMGVASDWPVFARLWLARCALITGLALAGGGVMALIYPAFFDGPLAEVDPDALKILGDTIIELQPLWPDSPARLGSMLRYLGAGLIGAPMLAWALTSISERGRRPLWVYLAVGLAITTGLSFAYFRFSPLFALFVAFPAAAFIGRMFETIGQRLEATTAALVRSPAVLAILMLPIVLEAGVNRTGGEAAGRLAAPDCPIEDILPALAEGPFAEPQIILSNALGLATEILYRTPHSVVATPYYGNARAIIDAHRVFTAEYETPALAVMGQRRIDAIVICRGAGRTLWAPTTRYGPIIHQRLLDEDAPSWLRKVALPEPAASRFVLYTAIRGGMLR